MSRIFELREKAAKDKKRIILPEGEDKRVVEAASVIVREGPEPRPGNWPPVEEPTPPQERKAYPGEGREILHEEKNKW